MMTTKSLIKNGCRNFIFHFWSIRPRQIFSVVFISTILLTCGAKKEETTEAKLTVGAIGGLPFTDGGVILIGGGPNGQFVKNLSNGTVSYTLVKGPWTFRAIAWGGPGPMEGNLRCAHMATQLTQILRPFP